MRVYVHFPIDKCRIWKNVQPYTESKKDDSDRNQIWKRNYGKGVYKELYQRKLLSKEELNRLLNKNK